MVKHGEADEGQIVSQALDILKSGGVVIYPTETCYGIGVDATASNAVNKLIQYKGDRKNKPISIAVADKKMAQDYSEFNPAAENLFDNFLPGPITVVCQGKHRVDSRLESEMGTLGLRCPKHDLALKIIRAFGKPITSTSANVSNGKTPYEISDILDNLPESKKELIGLIIDAGKLPHHPPSTIVDITLNTPRVLRQGEFIFENKKVKKFISSSVEETIRFAKNLVSKYYVPRTKYCLIFALQGELGAGKTQFAKGIAKGLGIKDNIKSPTFILCAEHKIQKNHYIDSGWSLPRTALRGRNDTEDCKMYHIDTWRMRGESELLDIGFEQMIKPGNVIAIEWGEKMFEILKKIEKKEDVKVVWVKIEFTEENKRKIMVNSV